MRNLAVLALIAILIPSCGSGTDNAAQQAEIERLQAESEKLRAEATLLRQENARKQAEWDADAVARETRKITEERYFGTAVKRVEGQKAAVEKAAVEGAEEASEP